MLFISQGFFIATREERPETTFFPDKSFLRELLHRAGGYDLLASEEASLPDWLGPL